MVAAGAVEQPLIFRNDLVGVMLPEAVRRLMGRWSLMPGSRAVVIAATRPPRQFRRSPGAGRDAGVRGQRVDLREQRIRQIAGKGRAGRLEAVELDGRKVGRDSSCPAAGPRTRSSRTQAERWSTPTAGSSCRRTSPTGSRSVGAAAGEVGDATVPPATFNGAAKKECFVCICEDVTDKDVKRYIAEGFDSIELAKRYTTVTMGPCQGKLCHVLHPALRARERDRRGDYRHDHRAPTWQPVELGLLAGRPHELAQRPRSTTATRSSARR